jgi:hypothetical protein
MDVTVSGTFMAAIDEHPLNAYLTICVVVGGRIIDLRDVHP